MLIDFSKESQNDWVVRRKATGSKLYGVSRANDDEGWWETLRADPSPVAGHGNQSRQPATRAGTGKVFS